MSMSTKNASTCYEPDGTIVPTNEPRNRQSHGSPALRRIAVDVTPLLVGPDNGGAGLVATTVVSHLSRLAPKCEFVLLTSAANHTALQGLDRPNTRRVNIEIQEASDVP